MANKTAIKVWGANGANRFEVCKSREEAHRRCAELNGRFKILRRMNPENEQKYRYSSAIILDGEEAEEAFKEQAWEQALISVAQEVE